MSIGAKRRAREERRRQKEKKKASKAAEYAARMAAGTNGKSAAGDAAPKRMATLTPHAVADCGNTGCLRCHPELAGRRWRAERGGVVHREDVRSIIVTTELPRTITVLR